MRRRGPGGENSGPNRSASSAVGSLQRFKRLDVYARPKHEFQRTTTHGGIVSLVLAYLVGYLTWRELRFSMHTERVERLFVNSTIAPKVNVTFDIVFPRISCGYLSLDTEDHSGMPQAGVVSQVVRLRLDLQGRPLGEEEKHGLGNTLKEAMAKAEESESESESESASEGERRRTEREAKPAEEMSDCNCYGAGAEGECCRTCQDIRAAYRRRGWKFHRAAIPICGSSTATDEAAPEAEESPGPFADDEGCRLAGSVEMTKTQGNFHFAPGRRLHRRVNTMSMMDQLQVALESFNTTHTIETLSFGDQFPDGNAPTPSSSVLEGYHKIVEKSHVMHQYFLQLVPTTYSSLDGSTTYGSQYSVTEHLKHVSTLGKSGLPGVYFYYEVSPVQALVEERRQGFLSFLSSTCGVVGGVYGLLGLVNTVIESFTTRSRKRLL